MTGRRIRNTIQALLLAALFSLALAAQTRAATLNLPVTLDYPLLQSLIIRQAYRDPDTTARIWDPADGCNRIVLSHPQIRHDRDWVRFQTRVSLTAGTPMGDYCITPLSWEGEVVLWQEPMVDKTWQLRFTPRDSALLDLEGRPARLAGFLWELIKTHVHGYLNTVVIDLAPPVGDLKTFLLPLFDEAHQTAAHRMLASMVPAPVRITPDALKVDILAEVPDTDTPAAADTGSEAEPLPAPGDLTRIMALWETWDTVLVHMLTELLGEPLSPAERQILLDTLLAARYEFSAELAEGRLNDAFVHHQFIQAWQQIKPVFHNHLGDDPAKSVLGYLAFFTAADALAALDQMGPSLGLEISRDGFLRLAAMISDQPSDQSSDQPLDLETEPGALNPGLREVLGLGNPLESPSAETPEPWPAAPVPDNPAPDNTNPDERDRPQSRWWPFFRDGLYNALGFADPAWAGTPPRPGIADLQRWTAEVNSPPAYLERVVDLLAKASRQTAQENLSARRRDWFEQMVMATAWQESCFRQFRTQKGKIVYLLSYNGSSVGLMQINERVWSGLYDRHRLRWDIHYNAAAGCEILALYLKRYILKTGAPKVSGADPGPRYLAGWLYALYNGGPRQLQRYPQRQAKGKLYQSDRLLLAKYDQVTGKDDWTAKVDCLPQR